MSDAEEFTLGTIHLADPTWRPEIVNNAPDVFPLSDEEYQIELRKEHKSLTAACINEATEKERKRCADIVRQFAGSDKNVNAMARKLHRIADEIEQG